MAIEQQPGLSVPSSIERKPSEVESPPHNVAGVERSVYRKGLKQPMLSEFEGHMKTGTFLMREGFESSRGVVRCRNSARKGRTRIAPSQWPSNNNPG